MTDRLLTLANHPFAAPLVRALGLPSPRPLLRADGPYAERELSGRTAAVVAGEGGFAGDACRAALGAQGAALEAAGPLRALVVDATGLRRTGELRFLREAVAAAVPRLAGGARVLLLAHATPADPEAAACARAVEGFMRSLAKEIGRRGATANGVEVEPHALQGLPAAIAFFCSDRSAYVSGQVLRLAASASTDAPRERLLAGRAALVTGAAGGIGAATARRLAGEGAFVLCADVPASATALEALAASIGGAALALDITAPDAAARLLAAGQARGGLDVVVHNAGITRDRTLAKMSAAEWDAVIGVNLASVLAIDAALDAAGALRGGSRSVYLSSISGIAGNAGQSNYSTAKAALIGYVRARAAMLSRSGGTANAVAPGFIETAMTARIPFMVREVGRRLNALSQGGRPGDVAEAICWLARPDAQGFNGQALRVCGQSFLGA